MASSKGDRGTAQDSSLSLQSELTDALGRMARVPTTNSNEDALKERDRSRQIALAKIAGEMGRRYSPEHVSLQNYVCRTPAQRQLLANLKQIAADLGTRVGDGESLFWYGSVGTGKDHLMAAMLHIAAGKFGLQCKWVNGQWLFGMFRDRMDGKSSESDLIRQMVEPDILAISDPVPPAGEMSAWNANSLYRIVDRRYSALKPTWVTINVRDEAEADARLTNQVFDRLRDSAHLFPCFWESHRVSK